MNASAFFTGPNRMSRLRLTLLKTALSPRAAVTIAACGPASAKPGGSFSIASHVTDISPADAGSTALTAPLPGPDKTVPA
jgi:hypothetical protein